MQSKNATTAANTTGSATRENTSATAGHRSSSATTTNGNARATVSGTTDSFGTTGYTLPASTSAVTDFMEGLTINGSVAGLGIGKVMHTACNTAPLPREVKLLVVKTKVNQSVNAAVAATNESESPTLLKLQVHACNAKYLEWRTTFLQVCQKKFGNQPRFFLPLDEREGKVLFDPVGSKPEQPMSLSMYQQACTKEVSDATAHYLDWARAAIFLEKGQKAPTSGNSSRIFLQHVSTDENAESDAAPTTDTSAPDTSATNITMTTDIVMTEATITPANCTDLSMACFMQEKARVAIDTAKSERDELSKEYSYVMGAYESKRKQYTNLVTCHDQWISVLKESVDPVIVATTLKPCKTLVEMLDTLFTYCNSKSKVTMQAEWDERWGSTIEVFPPELKLWHELRDRYFHIHGGPSNDLDRQLGIIFKQRLFEVIPSDAQAYSGLPMTILADDDNDLGSGKILDTLSKCESRAHQMGRKLKPQPTSAKLAGQKRPLEDVSKGVYCTFHKRDSHATEDCRSLREQNEAKIEKSKPQQKFKAKSARLAPPKAKASPGKSTKSAPSNKDTEIKKLRADLKAANAKIATISEEEVPAKKVRILKIATGEEQLIHYLDDIPDSHLLNDKTTVYLDCGANQHVTPLELAMDGVREVSRPYVINTATNNKSIVKMEGDFTHYVGGKSVTFKNALPCENVTDTLISCSKWLSGTGDRIILTATDAFHQEANTKRLKQIARVVNGMYCMSPLATLDNQPQQATAHLIHSSKLGRPTSRFNVVTDEGVSFGYSKPKIQTSEFELAQAIAIEEVGNYVTTCSAKVTKIPPSAASEDDFSFIKRIHNRFGHYNLNTIVNTIRNNEKGSSNKELSFLVKTLSKFTSYPKILEACQSCALGKTTQKPVYATDSPAEIILSRIHTDCFQLPVESPNRNQYGTIIVDGFSRYTEMEFHRNKSDSVDKLKNTVTDWERHHSLNVAAIRHDGGELQKAFAEWCEQRDPFVRNETSPPYHKEFNGMAERTYGIHEANAIAMLNHANLPQTFRQFALSHSVWIKNRLCHPDNVTTSPYKMLYKMEPDLSQFHPFGCGATIYLHPDQRHGKFGNRGSRGIFLGYKRDTKGSTIMVFWDIERKKITLSNSCEFHDNEFPGTKTNGAFAGSSNKRSRESESVAEPRTLRPRISRGGNTDVTTSSRESTEPTSAEGSTEHVSDTDRSEDDSDTEGRLYVQHEPATSDDDETDETSSTDNEMQDPDMGSLESENEIQFSLSDYGEMADYLTTSGLLNEPDDSLDRSEVEEEYDEIAVSSQTQAKLMHWQIDAALTSKSKATNKDLSKILKVATPAPQDADLPYPNPMDSPPAGSISTKDIPPPPKSRKRMLEHPYSKYFIGAEQAELNAMKRKNVWCKGPKPQGRKLLRPKWVYSYKTDKETDTVSKFKARLVAMGNTQLKGIDYNETFSPVIKIQSLRIMIVIALRLKMIIEQSDVDTAYLNADLDVPNYMYMPPGYEETDSKGKPVVIHLLKSLYGLHQSGREWNKHISKVLIECGFKRAMTDPCLFIKRNKNKSFILLYVDDLIIMAMTKGEVEEIKSSLKEHFSLKEMGEAHHVLGMQIERIKNGIYLGQPKYAQEILESTGMDGDNVSPVPTPMSVGWEHDPTSPPLNKEQLKLYHSITMKLSYLATQTRPDLAFAVNTLAQFQKDCREHNWKALLRVLRYLKGTHDYGLFFTNEDQTHATLHTSEDYPIAALNDSEKQNMHDECKKYIPTAYADASYAQDLGRKSRSGHVFMMAGAAVTWYCKKQPVVALSSTEAEFYALSEAVKESLWIRQLLNEIGLTLNDPTVVHQDNMSTMAIALNPIQHQRVKHIDVKVYFLRDHLDKRHVKLVYCPTEDMIADIFTKALPMSSHRKFTNLLGLRSLDVLQSRKPSNFTNERHF
jgi:hypothetical protein